VAATVTGCGGEPAPTCTDALDPNNSREAAARLAAGAKSGLRTCAGDEDWYVVTLGAGETLAVNADFQGAPETLKVQLIEPIQGAVVAQLGPGGGGLEGSMQPGAAGDYFIRVTTPSTTPVAYDLAVAMSPATQTCETGFHPQNGTCVQDGCDDLGLEANDDVMTARPLLPGLYSGLKICKAGDRDFFALQPPPGGGAFSVSMWRTKGQDIDLVITTGEVVNGKYKVLGAAQSSGGEDHLLYVPVPDGQPAFLMVLGDKDSTGTYDLELRVDPLDPKRDCVTGCNEIVPMDGTFDMDDPAALVAGYFIGTDEEYRFVRRDLGMWLQWAFGEMEKKFPGTPPVYLSDISQEDGKTPGTMFNRPRHPTTTHVNGRDCDIAYYQTLPDNDYRIICGDGTDRNGNGTPGKYNDGYFCTTNQNVVDVTRQTYFMALLMAHPQFRVLGIDQTLPQLFYEEVERLVGNGDLPGWAAYKIENGLAWGAEGGWQFHHHHIHLSLFDR
jgi:hypothetical protein